MAARWSSGQLCTVLLELSSALPVCESRQTVGEIVLLGWDPGRCGPEPSFDLLRRNPSGHTEAQVFSRSAIREQVIAGFVIRVYGNLTITPFVLPQVNGNHMCDELEVRYVELQELVWNRAQKILMIVVIVGPEARSSVFETVGRGIEGYMDS